MSEGGAQRSANLTRTREQGHTEVPTCMDPLSCWRDKTASFTGSSIPGESVSFMLSLFSLSLSLSLAVWSFDSKFLTRNAGDGRCSIVLCFGLWAKRSIWVLECSPLGYCFLHLPSCSNTSFNASGMVNPESKITLRNAPLFLRSEWQIRKTKAFRKGCRK